MTRLGNGEVADPRDGRDDTREPCCCYTEAPWSTSASGPGDGKLDRGADRRGRKAAGIVRGDRIIAIRKRGIRSRNMCDDVGKPWNNATAQLTALPRVRKS
jgi:hypothetical protein